VATTLGGGAAALRRQIEDGPSCGGLHGISVQELRSQPELEAAPGASAWRGRPGGGSGPASALAGCANKPGRRAACYGASGLAGVLLAALARCCKTQSSPSGKRPAGAGGESGGGVPAQRLVHETSASGRHGCFIEPQAVIALGQIAWREWEGQGAQAEQTGGWPNSVALVGGCKAEALGPFQEALVPQLDFRPGPGALNGLGLAPCAASSPRSAPPGCLHRAAPTPSLWAAAPCRRPGGGAGECPAAAALRVVAITRPNTGGINREPQRASAGGPDGPGPVWFLACAVPTACPGAPWCSPNIGDEQSCSRTSPPSVAMWRRIAAILAALQSLPLPHASSKAPAWLACFDEVGAGTDRARARPGDRPGCAIWPIGPG